MSGAAGPPQDPTPPDDRSVGELVLDVSERVSTLIREEIELAKTEIREKVTKLVQGSVVGIAAGVFALLGLAMLMHGIAWLLNDLFFEDDVWIGFLVEAALLVRCRGGRRLLRLPLAAGRRSAHPGPGDRGGPANQGDPGGRHALNGSTDLYVSGAGEPVGRAAAGRARAQLGPDPGRHRAPALGAGPLGRGPPRPRRRAHRLASPDPRASPRAGDRRRGASASRSAP